MILTYNEAPPWTPRSPALLLLGVLLGPVLRRLFKARFSALVFVRDRTLNGIVSMWIPNAVSTAQPSRRLSRILRVRFQQKTSGHLEYGGDFTAGLPRVAAEDSKAHASLVIIRHVRVVDFSLERQNRRLEWVVVGKCQKQLECSALCAVVKLSFSERRTPGGLNERRMESPWDP
jgi:hypothetical protein